MSTANQETVTNFVQVDVVRAEKSALFLGIFHVKSNIVKTYSREDMTRHRRSLQLEKELYLAKKKLEKFETVERASDKRKSDVQQELLCASKNVGRLKISCCSSLEIEKRVEQEIFLCRDRTCELEGRDCQVSNVETAFHSLENNKESLYQELLERPEKKADGEIAPDSLQQERGCVKNGRAREGVKTNKREIWIGKLKSDKEYLGGEPMKSREVISTSESQIGTLLLDKNELSAESKETKKSDVESNLEFGKRFIDGGNSERSIPSQQFILGTYDEKSTDEIRKLHEVAADLETKHATCKAELENQQNLITTIISREKAVSRAAREAARDLQLQLDESRHEIEKRDVMVKTLAEDKRRLVHNILEFRRNYQQKCDTFDAELDAQKTVCVRPRVEDRLVCTNLQDYEEKFQQLADLISQEPNRQITGSSWYYSHEQKAATSLYKASKSVHGDYAKRDRENIESLSPGESLLQDSGERKKEIFRGHLPKKRKDKSVEVGNRRQFHATVKSASESADIEWNEPHADCVSKYRESCHDQTVRKTLLMAEEEGRAPTVEMENELNERSIENDSKIEEYQPDIDGVRSENDAVEIENCSSTLEEQEIEQVEPSNVSNGDEIACPIVESEFTNGHASLVPDEQENDFAATTIDDFESVKKRKEELQQLCEELMEERDKATRSLKGRDDEILRLRMRAVETEHEKADLKIQLAKASDRSDVLENELASVKEENEKLKAEVERLRKRIEELEAENSDLKSKLQARADQDHADGKKETADLENAEVAGTVAGKVSGTLVVEDQAEEPVTVQNEERLESEPQEHERRDKTTTSNGAAKESAPATDEGAVKRRENKRTAPNYYRHSFTGSLPRPFHRHELHLQRSFDHNPKHERSESFHSDTSEENESGSHAAAPSVPSFMKRKASNPYLKSGFSPVQFNYQPLPESISNKRESWLDGVRARGDSLSRVRDSSSDSEGSGIGNGASHSVEKNHEWVECGETANTLNSAPDEHRKKHAENTENSTKDLLQSTHEEQQESVSLSEQPSENVTGQAQVDVEEQERREHVSDLVSMWNSRTAEAADI